VIAIDRDRRTVTLAGAPRTELRYDQLVLCAGSRAEIPAAAWRWSPCTPSAPAGC